MGYSDSATMLRHPYKTWVEISRQALIHNIGVFKKLIGTKTQLMAVVKSNAYGHDLEHVVPIMARSAVSWFGVDSIDEALRIDALRDEHPVLILGYTPLNRLEEAVRHGYRLTVYNSETIRALGKITKRLNRQSYVHIKCETGTGRQGISLEELVPLARLIGTFPGLILEGLSTHFANIEDTTDHSYAEAQLLKFKRMITMLENVGIRVPVKHAACSAATILFPETHFTMARVGVSLYGHWPSRETLVSANGLRRKIELKPVLTWKTCIAQIKKLPRGASVSYGLTERLSRDSRIAVLPIGYWDGFDRKLSSVGTVLVQGKRAKILGRICMNMCLADVTDIRSARLEDEVVLIGRQGREMIPAEEIAQKINTINYEVITRINPLIPRRVV